MAMSDEQVRVLLRRYVEDPWNVGDLDALDEVTADDFELQGGRNLEEFKEIIRDFRQGFPDWTVTIGDVVAQDDRIAFRWTMRGTHQGEFEGIAPSGRSVTADGMTFLRLKDGKVAEDHFESSSPSATQQLGLP
jgi:steroid delta-isomerase-like uncharacterized protein